MDAGFSPYPRRTLGTSQCLDVATVPELLSAKHKKSKCQREQQEQNESRGCGGAEVTHFFSSLVSFFLGHLEEQDQNEIHLQTAGRVQNEPTAKVQNSFALDFEAHMRSCS